MTSIHLGLAIASNQPHKLSEFYAFATNGELCPGENEEHWRVTHENGMSVHLYKPSKNRPLPSSGSSAILCLSKGPTQDPLLSIREWLATLVSVGAIVDQQPRVESFGAESWLKDPEGNYFLIFVPSL